MRKHKSRGASSDTKPGRKPAVANLTELAAKKNIYDKIELLKKQLQNSADGDVQCDMPLSTRQFNHWTPSDRGKKLSRNSQETLRRYPDMHSSVIELVGKFKELAKPITKIGKEEAIASLRRTLNLHKTIRVIAERALICARDEKAKADAEAVRAKSALASERKASIARISELEQETASLRSANADLLKQLSKVVRLK